jgi:hypothetical protein
LVTLGATEGDSQRTIAQRDRRAIEAYSRHPVEVQSDNGWDGGVKGIERPAIVSMHNPPGLEVRNDLFDHVPDLVYLERYSKPHVIEKKKNARAASNASW